MKKKLVAMLLISAVAFSFISCGNSDKKDEEISNKGESTEQSSTDNDSKGKGEYEDKDKDKEIVDEIATSNSEDKNNDKDKDNKEEEKVEGKFDKFSDEEIIKFANDSIAFYKELDSKKGEIKVVDDESYFLMAKPYDTIAKRKEALSKYFTEGAVNEEYKTIDSKDCVNSILSLEFDIEYNYKKVLKRKVDGDKIKVTFNTEVKSMKGVEDEKKTLEFKLVGNEIKLTEKSFSTTWYDVNH